ncbi:MAG: WD40/YVTN/BNR-like repeat-containing protein [Gemmatimonadaceae bacterium]
MPHIRPLACAIAVTALFTALSSAQSSANLDSATLAALRWRPIGPANMAGRVSDVEGIPSPSRTFYFAAAAGGIWKTTNAGTTFRPVFQNERCISMGDLAIAPSDTNVLYAGTGEEDSRNSISPGCGIFKSTDGGRTWKLMGLEKSGAVGRIVVHPRDPSTAYVAALGQIWSSNRERGLYKTTDGGTTWTLAKFISDRAGFVDVALDPSNPDILYASSWDRVRGPYFLRSGGPGSALWKSADAGKTWTKIEGGGFPETMKGRIGIAVSPSNSSIVYALVEADSIRGQKPQKLRSGLYRSADAGKTWTKMADQDVRPFYYSQVRVHPHNPEKVWWSSTPVNFSEDGGKTVRQATVGIHVDHHAMWIDPNDPEHHIVGNDGGVAQSWDGGGNYDFMNSVPLGQFYEASYDFAVPYRVCGGLQDNGSWCGPSRRKRGDITNAMWFNFNGGDGFFTAQDPAEPNILYGESQGGNIARFNFATGERQLLVKPGWRPRYMQVEDSILVTRGDTSRPLPSTVARDVEALRRLQRADSASLDLRWNWNTPFFLSVHNPHVLYAGANRVLKSSRRGDDLHLISPDLSRKLWSKIDTSMRKTGGITLDATGAETYGTIVALAESPMRPGLLYAGTDDGNVWITLNDGGSWEEITRRFPSLPPNTYVRRIEPSRFDTGTVYIAFDNHRVNDFAPYVYASTDFGKTFRSIVSDLPRGGPDFVHVIREDPHNRDLLFVGTDVGVYMSRDRGAHWSRFMSGLPTVPVHDLQIHPREHELIAATHGRSIWIVDILPLEQMTDSVVRKVAHMFVPKVAYQYGETPVGGESSGHKLFTADSPPYGAELYYRVTRNPQLLAQTTDGDSAKMNGARTDSTSPEAAATRSVADTTAGRVARNAARANRLAARIVITDVRGDTIKTLVGPGGPGLHKAVWDLRGKPAPPPLLGPAGKRDSIVAARKLESVLDSLARTGTPPAVIQAVRNALSSGDAGSLFRRGRRRGAPGEFIERPGESPPSHEATAAPPDPDTVSDVLRILRRSGAIGNVNFFSSDGPPPAAPGEYLVTIRVAGETMRQVLRVEKVSGDEGEAVGVRK